MLESQYPALKADIQTDPRGRGFAGKTDQQIADIYNEVRAAWIDRQEVNGGEIVAAIVKSAYTALSANDKAYLNFVVSAGTAITLTTTFKNEMGALFPNGPTLTNLIALLTRPGTDGEKLGFGRVEAWDVGRAKALP